MLKRAKPAGFLIEGVFVLTASEGLNVFRVRSCELSGGHGVPPDKTHSRYAKPLAYIPLFLALCDVCQIVDNTDEQEAI